MPCLSVENEVNSYKIIHHFTIIFQGKSHLLDLQQLARFVVKKIEKYEKLWCYLLMIGQYIKYWIMIGLIISQGQTKVKILWGRKKKQKMRNVSILLSWKHNLGYWRSTVNITLARAAINLCNCMHIWYYYYLLY
mgnify:CR=1 FL=1